MLKGTIYLSRPHMNDVDLDFSWRDVSKTPKPQRKPKSAKKLKLTLSSEIHRKPTHKSGKVICYRIKEVN